MTPTDPPLVRDDRAALERGSVARVTWPDNVVTGVDLRGSQRKRQCEFPGCFRMIERGEIHGTRNSIHVCFAHCEPIPAAARERELAERAAERDKHEGELALQLRAAGIGFVRQGQVAGWDWDFQFGDIFEHKSPRQLLVDVQGGLGPPGSKATKHGSAEGYRTDCLKLAEAVRLGYRAIFVTGAMVSSGEALQVIESLLAPTVGVARGDGADGTRDGEGVT